MVFSGIKKPYLIATILLIIVPGIIFMNSYQGLWWDEAVYLGLAKSLTNGSYQINQGDEIFRAPFFPFALSFFLFLGNLRVISIFFAVISIIVTYLFAKGLYDRRIAIMAAFFLATSHLFLFYSQKILTETLFCTLFTLALYSFYLGIEKNKKCLPAAGIFTALSFLTRYPGIILIPIFFFYMILRLIEQKKRYNLLSRFLSKEFISAILLFIIILIPWLWHSQIVYDDLFGVLKIQSTTLVGYYEGPWYYYIRHIFEGFGFVILFSIPALAFALFSRKNSDKLILLSIIMTMLFFSFAIARKEMRYLIPFSSVFYIFSAFGVQKFGEWLNKKKLIIAIAVLFALFSFLVGLSMIHSDLNSGKAMMDAAEWIENNTEPNSYIIAENYPIINHISERKVFMFPSNISLFDGIVDEYNITYCLVDNMESTTPEYAKSLPYPLAVRFEVEKQIVSIYKLR